MDNSTPSLTLRVRRKQACSWRTRSVSDGVTKTHPTTQRETRNGPAEGAKFFAIPLTCEACDGIRHAGRTLANRGEMMRRLILAGGVFCAGMALSILSEVQADSMP